MAQHLSDGIHDVREIEIACGDLVQHRRKEEEVLPADERHFESRISALLKLQRGIQPAESTAQNQDTRLVRHAHSSRRAAIAYARPAIQGSARFQRAGFGILPKRTFPETPNCALTSNACRKVRDGRMPSPARWKRALPRPAQAAALEHRV